MDRLHKNFVSCSIQMLVVYTPNVQRSDCIPLDCFEDFLLSHHFGSPTGIRQLVCLNYVYEMCDLIKKL